jgi:hypothetical protein
MVAITRKALTAIIDSTGQRDIHPLDVEPSLSSRRRLGEEPPAANFLAKLSSERVGSPRVAEAIDWAPLRAAGFLTLETRKEIVVMRSRQQITALGFRWLARLTSLVSIGILSLFLFGEPLNLSRITAREWIGLAFFPAGVVIGMIIAWWREGLGAAVSIASLLGFYTIFGWLLGSRVNGPWFVVFVSPAFLFLIAWFLSRRNPREVTA